MLRRSYPLAVLAFSALALFGCDGAATDGSGDVADMGADDGGGGAGPDLAPPYPAWNAQSPAICGQTPYTWQPASKVGTVLDYSRNLLPTLKFVIQTLEVAAFLGSQLNVHH